MELKQDPVVVSSLQRFDVGVCIWVGSALTCDVVSRHDGGEAVGNNQGGAPCHQPVQSPLYQPL